MNTSVFTNAGSPLSLEKLRATGSINDLAKDKFNNSLSLIAAQHNDVSTLKRIDFNTIDPSKRSLVLVRAAFCNSNEVTDYLLKIPGMDVNYYETPAIFGAIENKNYELAQKISMHPTFRPNASNLEGDNLLHCIAVTKNPTKETNIYAQRLIDLKVIDLNEKNKFGFTPLNEACCAGNLQLVELFLKNGAKLDTVDLEDRTALHVAALSSNATLVQFLLDKGLDCNALEVNNKTPLHYAILNEEKEVVKTLVSAPGANCNIRSSEGFRPLDLACIHKFYDLIPFLLPKATLSRKDLESDSALMQAIPYCESSG